MVSINYWKQCHWNDSWTEFYTKRVFRGTLKSSRFQGWFFSRHSPSSRLECAMKRPMSIERGNWLAPKFVSETIFWDARHVCLHVSPLSPCKFWLSAWHRDYKIKFDLIDCARLSTISFPLFDFHFIYFLLFRLRECAHFIIASKFCNQTIYILCIHTKYKRIVMFDQNQHICRRHQDAIVERNINNLFGNSDSWK